MIYCVLTAWLHCAPKYRIGISGAYRDDTSYLERCAQRIAMLQRIAFSMGMNCYVSNRVIRLANTQRRSPLSPIHRGILCQYNAVGFGVCLTAADALSIQVETHIDRVSEDLQVLSTDLCCHFALEP